ncbi:hypothetical protein JCM6882_006628 [Rhodosporidiobolus microsporus]
MAPIDSLPNELLIAILEQADAPALVLRRPDTTAYASCLVSRQWRECAQPLLWRSLALRGRNALRAVLDSGAALSYLAKVRSLSVECVDGMEDEAAELLRHLGTVEEVRINHSHTFPFATLTHLKHLRVEGVSLTELGLLPAFPSLRSLVLSWTRIPLSTARDFFTPAKLPTLKNLAFSELERFPTSSDDEPETLGEILSLDFAARLDIVQLQLDRSCTAIRDCAALVGDASDEDDSDAADGAARPLNNVLVTLETEHLRLAYSMSDFLCDVEHLCLEPREAEDGRIYTGDFTTGEEDFTFLSVLRRCTSLRTLLLPLEFSTSPLADLSLARYLDEILAACPVKDVEVIWADRPFREYEWGPVLREEFARWVRRQRGEQGSQEERG